MHDLLTLGQVASLAEGRVAALLRMYLEPMSAADHRALRIRLGHTQASLAELLGVDRVTVTQRDLGTKPVPREVALLLRQLAEVLP